MPPLLVPLRHRRIVVASVVCAVVAAIGLRLWRIDFDDEDNTAYVLGMTLLAFWLLALSLGMLVRSLVAGYALRLDAHGLHLPGWDVVPWTAIRSAELAQIRWPQDGRFAKLVLDIDDACLAHRRGSYERWLWGPISGLRSKKKVTELALFTLAIEPEQLRAALRSFMGPKAPTRSPRR
ncbi:MAG: hypothetical protein M3Z29_09050 [Pseudomonadota bacterium]|nr:hypothetical protein [Pseudomonadota bacterium]